MLLDVRLENLRYCADEILDEILCSRCAGVVYVPCCSALWLLRAVSQ